MPSARWTRSPRSLPTASAEVRASGRVRLRGVRRAAHAARHRIARVHPGQAMTELRGIPVCGGSRVGPALLYEEAPDVVLLPQGPPADVEAEVRRLRRALDAAR